MCLMCSAVECSGPSIVDSLLICNKSNEKYKTVKSHVAESSVILSSFIN